MGSERTRNQESEIAPRPSVFRGGMAGNFLKPSDFVRFRKPDPSHILAAGGNERLVGFRDGHHYLTDLVRRMTLSGRFGRCFPGIDCRFTRRSPCPFLKIDNGMGAVV